MNKQMILELVESVNRLAATETTSEFVAGRVDDVRLHVDKISSSIQPIEKDDILVKQIDSIKSSISAPAYNYTKMVSILDGLRHAAVLSQRPQNADIKPRIAGIIRKVAGLYQQVDTVEDLNRPLAKIEKAVHALYGGRGGELGQSKNSVHYFERAGKGYHNKEKK